MVLRRTVTVGVGSGAGVVVVAGGGGPEELGGDAVADGG